MSSQKLVIFVGGPSASGKTTVANFLEGSERQTSSEHRPTQGVRILEFERKIQLESKKGHRARDATVTVELWDCSGDARFQSHWSSLSKLANGVILVYSPEDKQEKDLEIWHSFFPHLKEEAIRIFAHRHNANAPVKKGDRPKLGKQFGKIPVIYSSVEHEGDAMKEEFDALVGHAYLNMLERREMEEQSIMNK